MTDNGQNKGRQIYSELLIAGKRILKKRTDRRQRLLQLKKRRADGNKN
jgi:hypothetical protein